jgi:hypothetical protein
MAGGNEERGVLINETPNQGVREIKMLGYTALECPMVMMAILVETWIVM